MGRVRKILSVWLVMLSLLLSCDKEKYRVVPYVDVYLTVNLNIVNDLMVPGNSVFVGSQGFGGIVIYCVEPGLIYNAYDGACTHEIRSSCRVKNEGILATCPCCGSQFILMGQAYPSKGPASFPLQPYNTSVTGNTLRVYN